MEAENQAGGSVMRRCVAPGLFFLVALWGATWMAQPQHVPADIDRVHAALQRVHPTDQADPGPALTPAERAVRVAGAIGAMADIALAASLLAMLFGVLAGPAPRPRLFRLHRWSRFVALCISLALGVSALAELSPDAAIALIGLVPFAVPIAIAVGLVYAFLPRRDAGAAEAGPPERRPFASLLPHADAPLLWSLVDQAAVRSGVPRPRHVLGGMADGFFLQASHVHPVGSKRAVGGSVLHVPLPLLPLLSRDELLGALVRTLVRDGRPPRWWRVGAGRADAAAASAVGAQAAETSRLRVRAGMALLRDRLDALAGVPAMAPDDVAAALLAQASAGLPDPLLVGGDPEDGGHGTGWAAARRLRRLRAGQDPVVVARARAAPGPAELAFAASLLRHGPALCATLTARLVEQARADAGMLDAVLDEVCGSRPPIVTVHENGLGQAWIGAGLLVPGGLVLAFAGGAGIRVAVVSAALLGLACLGYAAVVFRRRDVPVVLADADGLCCAGLAGPALPWSAISSVVGLAVAGVLTIDVRLTPATVLPQRAGFHPLLQLRRRSRRLVIGGVMPGRAGLRRCQPQLEALSGFVAVQAIAAARAEGAVVPLGRLDPG